MTSDEIERLLLLANAYLRRPCGGVIPDISVTPGPLVSSLADALEDELFAFERLVSDNPGLRDALSDPARSVDDKRSLLHELLDGKATPATVRLAEQSLSGSHRTVVVAPPRGVRRRSHGRVR